MGGAFALGRNRASSGELFQRVLAGHRALFDLGLPLVHADFEHAIDTWQWTLRLDPDASFAAQVGALFHDIERVESEPLVRVEHRAPSYDAFKEAHARRGAVITRGVLTDLGVEGALVERVAVIVERHERPSDDPEIQLVNEADALSFFARNSAGFVDCYGPDHARMKVARSLARLGDRGRSFMDRIRVREDVAAMIGGAS